MEKILNIVIPMAGIGKPFQEAGYAFPKPLIDIKGKTMIEVVVANLRPSCEHRFIFICQREQYDKYDLYNILKNASRNNFEVVLLSGITQGAACTVLAATQYIQNDDELVIANADQVVDESMDEFLAEARAGEKDGLILTFPSSHPRWSYARADANGKVLEVAEKKVISDQATAGVYYFRTGSDFVSSAQAMIEKNIRHNNEFYVCPVFNEMIIQGKNVFIKKISAEHMHSLGTPEDLTAFIRNLEKQNPKPTS